MSDFPVSGAHIPVRVAERQVDGIDPETMNEPLARFWAAARRMPRYVRLAINLMRDSEVPLGAKARLGAVTVYVVSPIDLIPGVIPVAGQIDDLAVLLVGVRSALRSCPPDVAERHLLRAGLAMADFETDLDAARDAADWVVTKGMRFSRTMSTRARGMAGDLIREWRTRETGGRRGSAILDR